jgi:hypothetical protein
MRALANSVFARSVIHHTCNTPRRPSHHGHCSRRFASAAATASYQMDETEKYLFDLHGYLVVPQVRLVTTRSACRAFLWLEAATLSPSKPTPPHPAAPTCACLFRQVFSKQEVADVNAAIDAHKAAFKARGGGTWQ